MARGRGRRTLCGRHKTIKWRRKPKPKKLSRRQGVEARKLTKWLNKNTYLGCQPITDQRALKAALERADVIITVRQRER